VSRCEPTRGSPIFYSLGNFAIEQPQVWDPRITQTASFKHLQSLNPTWSLDRAYTLPPDTRWSGIATQKRTSLSLGLAPIVIRPPVPVNLIASNTVIASGDIGASVDIAKPSGKP